MFRETSTFDGSVEQNESIKKNRVSPEELHPANDSVVNGTVTTKNEVGGYWSMVGTSHLYSPHAYNVKVFLPDGNDKWVSVSKDVFERLKEGDDLPVSLRPWEQKEYLSQLERIVEKAMSFDDLKAGLLSFEKISDRRRDYSIDDLVETLNHIQDESGSASFAFLPDIPGLKEKVISFKGESGKDTAIHVNLEDMSDDDLVNTYKDIQLQISNLIATRDSIEKNIDHAAGSKADFRVVHDRSQDKIEDAFAVLGKFRQMIDDRGLRASTLGEASKTVS